MLESNGQFARFATAELSIELSTRIYVIIVMNG